MTAYNNLPFLSRSLYKAESLAVSMQNKTLDLSWNNENLFLQAKKEEMSLDKKRVGFTFSWLLLQFCQYYT